MTGNRAEDGFETPKWAGVQYVGSKLAADYARKDFKVMTGAIFGGLRRILEKLDRKVDKG